jgi:hypothetical protein
VGEVPSAPSFPFSKSISTEFRCRAVPSEKILDEPLPFWAAMGDVPSAFSFCARCAGVEDPAFSLKQQRCPRCGKIETLNRHSVLRGNDPVQTSGQTVRGQRVFCSNRGQRGGCGKTFSLVLADVLPRHTLTASLVWQWLVKLLAGLSVKAAVEALRLPFALETMYRLRRGLQRSLDLVRTRLCREQSPAVSRQSQPLLQTVEHLRAVFPDSQCPPAAFQLDFQSPLLG